VTREEIKKRFELIQNQLNLSDEELERIVDETMNIGASYIKPEYNEVDWWGDFFIGVLLASASEGEYTVGKKEV
jgi:hypothetical protein